VSTPYTGAGILLLLLLIIIIMLPNQARASTPSAPLVLVSSNKLCRVTGLVAATTPTPLILCTCITTQRTCSPPCLLSPCTH
jgi:hypothetical protein